MSVILPFVKKNQSENRLHNVAVLAQHANLAYETPEVIESVTRDFAVYPFQNLMAHGFVSMREDTCIVSIAGTDDRHDALLDALFSYQQIDRFYVHTGFLLYAVLVREAISQLCLPRSWKYYFTGHSLGGAAAQLMPLLLRNVEDSNVVTFGAPRVMCEDSAGRYLTPCIRVVRREDIVPDYPPQRFLRFAHVGDERVLRGPGDLITGQHDWISRVCRAARLAMTRVRGRAAMEATIAKSHSMADYAEWLEPFMA